MEALLWESRGDDKVRCNLCCHRCIIKPEKRGLCGVRENRAGVLHTRVYGKLIAAVLIHRIHAAVNVTLWNTQRREVSMDKLYKRIQERAFSLLGLMLHSLTKAVIYLRKEMGLVLKHCLKNQQPSRLTTLEMLDAGFDQRLDNPETVSLS